MFETRLAYDTPEIRGSRLQAYRKRVLSRYFRNKSSPSSFSYAINHAWFVAHNSTRSGERVRSLSVLQLLIDYLCCADTSSKNAPCGFLSLSYGFRYLILQLEYLLQSFASHCNVFVTCTRTRLRIHDTHTLTYKVVY